MSFSDDFSDEFDHGKPAVGDRICLVFYWQDGQTTSKNVGTVRELQGPDNGDPTHVLTDITPYEQMRVDITKVRYNPTYKWVVEYTLNLK